MSLTTQYIPMPGGRGGGAIPGRGGGGGIPAIDEEEGTCPGPV